MGEKDESKLKKEFRERDVNRLRNLITKKYSNSTVTQVGYKKSEVDHKDGDVWEENGKEWMIKDGIRQSYTKLDEVKKALMMPFACPVCGKSMKSGLDKKMYPLHGKCFSCVVKTETLMRLNGTYNEYVENIVTNNAISFVDYAKDVVNDFKKESDDIYSEQGEKQDFVGGYNKKELADKWLKELEEAETTLKTK